MVWFGLVCETVWLQTGLTDLSWFGLCAGVQAGLTLYSGLLADSYTVRARGETPPPSPNIHHNVIF